VCVNDKIPLRGNLTFAFIRAMGVQAVRVVGTPIQISTTFINICQRKRSEPLNEIWSMR